MAVETIEKRSTSRKLAPQYRVLLHDDPHNSMEYVVQVLMQTLPSLSQPQAVNVMMEAHTNGMGTVTVCPMEPAEHYSEILKSNGLDSSIEAVD